jgi:hypothetical protein
VQKVALISVLCLATFGCGLIGPRLQPPVIELLSQTDLIVRADLIVIGAVRSIKDLGQEREVSLPGQDKSVKVRATSIELQIDAVLFRRRRGARPLNGRQSVVRWRDENYSIEREMGMKLDGREIQYLRENDDGVYYVVDVYTSSGSLPVANTTEYAMAELVSLGRRHLVDQLLPSSCQLDSRPQYFSKAVGSAIAVGGFTAVLPKLLEFTACDNSNVRIPACEALVENAFIGQDICILDPSTGQAVLGLSETVRQIVANRAVLEEKFKTAFIANPLATAKDYSVLPGVDGIVDFLNIIAKHPDSELADVAQRAIKDAAN